MGLFGPARSKLDRGLDAFERREWIRARRLLEEALAEEERAIGHYHLGLLYWRGLGGDRERRAAIDCFSRAAAMGHPAAQTAYAAVLRASGGAQNDAEAAALLRQAAGAGDCEAMIQLAAMCPEDEKRYWLGRASELGHAAAMPHYADALMARDPVEALGWLYAGAALSGQAADRRRAALLAQELTAAEIAAAEKSGRRILKDLREKERARR